MPSPVDVGDPKSETMRKIEAALQGAQEYVKLKEAQLKCLASMPWPASLAAVAVLEKAWRLERGLECQE